MAKVEFLKSGGKYYIEIKNKNLISATVTLSAEWDHQPEGFGDPMGKVVVKGSDNKRYELFTPGSQGSKSVSFPITKAHGNLYELKFDKTVDASVKTDKPTRLSVFHPTLTLKGAKAEIFIDKKGGDFGVRIPDGLLKGSTVEVYMEREDSRSSDGRALTAVEIVGDDGEFNRMSFNSSKTRDNETEVFSVRSAYTNFYAFDFEGIDQEIKFNRSGGGSYEGGSLPNEALLEFRDKDGSFNAFLYIKDKSPVVNKTQVEGATLNIALSDVVLDGGTTEPDIPPPPTPSGCGIDPPVITQNSSGKWGVSIPPDVLGEGDAPSTITLKFKKDDNPGSDGTAISTFTIKNFDGSEIMTVLDKGKEKTEKSVTFKVKSSADRFYKFKNMDNINEPVYNADRKRLEFRDNDGDDANAFIKIDSYDFTCDVKDTTLGPTDCPPGPWYEEGAIYEADKYEEPVTPSVDTSGRDGILCRKDTDKRVILDLKNYANKLVSFQLTYRVRASWTQKFEFNVPNCSDLIVDGRRHGTDANEYNVPIYNRTEKGHVDMVFNFHNVDGGHEYLFTHNHIVGPEPTRQKFDRVCTTTPVEVTLDDGSTGTSMVTTCVCAPTTTETWSEAGFKWPRFSGGVYITKSGGNTASWVYEDGGGTTGGAPDDQYVNIEVKAVKDTVPYTGTLSLCDIIQNLVWLDSDAAQGPENLGGKDGFSLMDYYEHSDKIRMRVPAEKRSLIYLKQGGADMTEFRGAGAAIYPAF